MYRFASLGEGEGEGGWPRGLASEWRLSTHYYIQTVFKMKLELLTILSVCLWSYYDPFSFLI